MPARRSPAMRLTDAIERLIADQRKFVAVALLLTALPLFWPTIPPLVDLPNHMSRYRIGLDYAFSPYFRQWFDFHWVLVGNLGVDLSVTALAHLIGLESATKFVVLAIPLLTVAGMALIAREVHGRVPATAAFAFVFAYNYPLNYGFVNFTLSAGLAFVGFGLWLRLGRLGHAHLRTWAFVPVGFTVWLAHACGWGMLGVMIFTAAMVEAREQRMGWPRAGVHAIAAAAPLAVSLLPMLSWFGGNPLNASATMMAFGVARKLGLLFQALRNDNNLLDVGSVLLVWVVLTLAIVRHDVRFDRKLGCVAAAMLATFVAMPGELMGAYHSDMRLAPYVVALGALAIRPIETTRYTRALATCAFLFLATRIGYQTASYVRLDKVYTRQLAALDHLPVGARVFGFAHVDCINDWQGDRMDHLNRIAIVRRQAFTNGTWPPPGSQTLFIHPAIIAGFHDESSQIFAPAKCRASMTQSIPGALAQLPRDRFDYFWLIDAPANLWPTRTWLQPVWHGEKGILYRVRRAGERRRDGEPHVIARRLAAA